MPTGSPPCRPRLCLPRAARLRLGRDFARLKTAGRRLVSGCLILNWAPDLERGRRRLGVVVSKKVGASVARSRARRLLREAWRRNQHGLNQPVDVVLVARASIAGKKLAQVEQDFQAALRRAGLAQSHEAGPQPHHP